VNRRVVCGGVAIGIGLGLLALVWVPGCTEVYAVEIRGTVRSAADGHPLAAALVFPPEAIGSAEPVFTGDDGAFTFGKRDVQGNRWSLTVKADGFVPEVVDIDPLKGFTLGKGKAPTLIVVVVSMRPKA
jgi:hypothetical protein